jgi:hypothetical protein
LVVIMPARAKAVSVESFFLLLFLRVTVYRKGV